MPCIMHENVSSRHATRRLSMPYLPLICRAMPPTVIIATVLLAVQMSTKDTSMAMIAIDACGGLADDVFYAAVSLHYLKQAPCKHRDDYQLTHAEDAVSHRSEPSIDVKNPFRHAYDACYDDAYCHYHEHIHSAYGSDYYYDVWQNLYVVGVRNLLWGRDVTANDGIQYE